MCLVLFSFAEDAKTPFIVAANRDEYFSRPTDAAKYWSDNPEVLAGRDKVAGGTWLGISRSGRFAAVTNVREPHVVVNNALSRGDLTRAFLTSHVSPKDYLENIQDQQQRYAGFNLLVGEFSNDKRQLFYFSNRKQGIHQLTSGIYGLSNHLLDSAWPKVEDGKHFMQQTITCTSNADDLHTRLREFLENPLTADDKRLPNTGVSYPREKALSAAFISLPDYGTRTSTVLTLSDNEIVFSEKHYVNDKHQQTPASAVHDVQVFRINNTLERVQVI
jgi:uncharacterized protein with NRDE domain